MMDIIRAHGTKLLGVVVTLLGILVGLDAAQQIELFGDAAQAIATTAAGLLVIIRGWINTNAIKATVAAGGTPE